METLILRLRRIHRLSDRPPNPGYAYRHLEHIRALSELLLREMGELPALEEAPEVQPPLMHELRQPPLYPVQESAS